MKLLLYTQQSIKPKSICIVQLIAKLKPILNKRTKSMAQVLFPPKSKGSNKRRRGFDELEEEPRPNWKDGYWRERERRYKDW